MNRSQYFALLLLLFLPACRAARQTAPTVKAFPGYENLAPEDRSWADSLLAYALDHEGLYSLVGHLKPISSVGPTLSFPIGKDSTDADGQAKVVSVANDSTQTMLRTLERWYRITDALSFGPYQFVVVPFRQVWEGDRNLQILLCRTDLIKQLLTDQATFFAQWGFVPGVDPAVLLTAVEFEARYDRYRAYGYLFGYPQTAVDFFVAAGKHYEATDTFVTRDFFHVPVAAASKGYFTYAVPQGYIPTEQDSTIYRQAVRTLDAYRARRARYVTPTGLRAMVLLRDWWVEAGGTLPRRSEP